MDDDILQPLNTDDLFAADKPVKTKDFFSSDNQSKDPFADDDDILPPLNTDDLFGSSALPPLFPTPQINGDQQEGDDEFELIQSEEAPSPEEAERELQRIEEEAEKRRRLEEQEKEEGEDGTNDETTDGGMCKYMYMYSR